MLLRHLIPTLWRDDIISHVDGVRGRDLRGWAFRRADMRRRMRIRVETRAGYFASHVADIYRADVHAAAVGSDGYCGFSIELSEFMAKGPYRLHDMTGGAVLLADPGSQHTANLHMKPKRIRGGLLFRAGSPAADLTGWVSSMHDASLRRRIVLEIDGDLAASQNACLYRPENAIEGMDPFHGFAFSMPPVWRFLRVVDAELGIQLFEQRRQSV